ncbi:hypothetical protein CORC01_09491 [Colletotrichum orchidophilum]|uniref:Uncharacterized protein n=1 Tax=Colletotrichum orchidophilum TaxID=1209926 RepID=A0A1G4B1D0_9PEZI|nr:uncharacterized protein CORC01_09491 [Colletotrichum orchidophilum]OHE95230.1 hypothetical protein CORC01_09491 [Colletotrichum orchidophilum]
MAALGRILTADSQLGFRSVKQILDFLFDSVALLISSLVNSPPRVCIATSQFGA